MTLPQEASILAKYLTGREATEEVLRLYTSALETIVPELTENEKRIWSFCITKQWPLKYIDAALAFDKRYPSIRRRIYIMLAIVEMQTVYSNLFLPQARSFSYNLKIFLLLLLSPGKVLMGKIILWLT